MKLLAIPAILLFAVLPTFADSFTVSVSVINPPSEVVTQLTADGNPLISARGSCDTSWNISFAEPTPGGTLLSWDISLGGQLVESFRAVGDCFPPVSLCNFSLSFEVPVFSTPVDGMFTAGVNG